MPNARPAAPGGAALRTSMSREGAITPPRNPASPIAAVSTIAGRPTSAITSTIAALIAKHAGGHLAVAVGAVGEIAAGKHARGAGAEKRRQRDIGRRERNAIAAHQRHHAEIADAGIGQAEQHERRWSAP